MEMQDLLGLRILKPAVTRFLHQKLQYSIFSLKTKPKFLGRGISYLLYHPYT